MTPRPSIQASIQAHELAIAWRDANPKTVARLSEAVYRDLIERVATALATRVAKLEAVEKAADDLSKLVTACGLKAGGLYAGATSDAILQARDRVRTILAETRR